MNTKVTKKKLCDLEIHTVKKNIKNIHLAVYPPKGRVRIAVPKDTSDEAVDAFVLSRMPWIKKQQTKYQRQQRQTEREFISGESHFFLGNKYLLNLVKSEGRPRIEVNGKTHITMYVRPDTSVQEKEELMENFYRAELKRRIPDLVSKWEMVTGISINEFRIKKMKTKWGTCSPKYRRIWINLELAKQSIQCLEYVLVHEMTHLLEKNHTEKFTKLMNSFMSQWEQCKQELNNSTLGYWRWPD